eukprot:scaffold161725_cov30-Tisochrysis_lutea.AAC.2
MQYVDADTMMGPLKSHNSRTSSSTRQGSSVFCGSCSESPEGRGRASNGLPRVGGGGIFKSQGALFIFPKVLRVATEAYLESAQNICVADCTRDRPLRDIVQEAERVVAHTIIAFGDFPRLSLTSHASIPCYLVQGLELGFGYNCHVAFVYAMVCSSIADRRVWVNDRSLQLIKLLGKQLGPRRWDVIRNTACSGSLA